MDEEGATSEPTSGRPIAIPFVPSDETLIDYDGESQAAFVVAMGTRSPTETPTFSPVAMEQPVMEEVSSSVSPTIAKPTLFQSSDSTLELVSNSSETTNETKIDESSTDSNTSIATSSENGQNDQVIEPEQAESQPAHSTAAEYYKQHAPSFSPDEDSYPLHDAVIASFLSSTTSQTPKTVSMDEIATTLEDCSEAASGNSNGLLATFSKAIPSIIDKAIKRFNTDTGRVLEVSQQEFELGQNYHVKVKSASVACYAETYPSSDLRDNSRKPAAYASYIVAPIDMEQATLDPSFSAHNLTMFIEADVMQASSNGHAYYSPKRYCLEGLSLSGEDSADARGMAGAGYVKRYTDEGGRGGLGRYEIEDDFFLDSSPFLDTTPILGSSTEHTRSIDLGSKQGVLASKLNRLGRQIGWIDILDEYSNATNSQYEKDLVLRSYVDPSLEMIYYAKVIVGVDYTCFDMQSIPLATKCVQDKIQEALFKDKVNATATFDATFHAIITYTEMKELVRLWQYHVREVNEEDLKGVQDSVVAGDLLSEEKANNLEKFSTSSRSKRFPVPYIFDRNIAFFQKTSGWPPIPVSLHSEGAKLEYPITNEEDASTLCEYSSPNRSEAVSFSSVHASKAFLNALVRRFYQFEGTPLTNVSDWKIYDETLDSNQPIQDDNMTVMFDRSGNLARGNLTERRLGRNAKWLMVTPWYGTEALQRLTERSQVSSSIFDRIGTEIYESDHPCRDAATNTDIFLFCISVAIAGFGAITGILRAFHSCFHWYAIYCFGPQQEKDSPPRPRRRCVILPYEIILISIGVLVFVGLFAPLTIQTIREFEIANYGREIASMTLDFSDRDSTDAVMTQAPGQAVIVTMAQMETYCADARPYTLLTIFVVGLFITVLANAPNLVRVAQALQRWCHGQEAYDADLSETEAGFTVFDEELVALSPQMASEFDETTGSLRQRLSLARTSSSSVPQRSSRDLGLRANATRQLDVSQQQIQQQQSSSVAVPQDVLDKLTELEAKVAKMKDLETKIALLESALGMSSRSRSPSPLSR